MIKIKCIVCVSWEPVMVRNWEPVMACHVAAFSPVFHKTSYSICSIDHELFLCLFSFHCVMVGFCCLLCFWSVGSTCSYGPCFLPVLFSPGEGVLRLVQSHTCWWMSMHVLFSAKMEKTWILCSAMLMLVHNSYMAISFHKTSRNCDDWSTLISV